MLQPQIVASGIVDSVRFTGRNALEGEFHCLHVKSKPELRLGAPCPEKNEAHTRWPPLHSRSIPTLVRSITGIVKCPERIKPNLFHTGEQRQGALQNDHYGESYSSLRLCQAVTTVNQDNFGGFSHARLIGKFPLLRTFRFIVATRFPDTDGDGPPLRTGDGSTCAVRSHAVSPAADRRNHR
jgi:hypothetical protein